MITIKTLRKLQYFNIGSWAIWDKKEDINFDFFAKHNNKLHGDIILLGLNRSGKDDKNNKKQNYKFNNFHSLKHKGDDRLEKFIQDAGLDRLKYSYMTDLFYERDGNSKNIKHNLTDTKSAVRKLLKQISIIHKKNNNSLKIICFGNDVFNYLVWGSLKKPNKKEKDFNNVKNINLELRYKKNKFNLSVYKVMHYSFRYNKVLLNKTLPNQLRLINDL